jgi:hypothetical protein
MTLTIKIFIVVLAVVGSLWFLLVAPIAQLSSQDFVGEYILTDIYARELIHLRKHITIPIEIELLSEQFPQTMQGSAL